MCYIFGPFHHCARKIACRTVADGSPSGGRLIRRRVIVSGLFLLLFGLGWWVGRGGASSDLYSNLDQFVEVIHKVQDNYVDPVEPAKLIDGALRGMIADLDPFSQYLDRRAYAQLLTVTTGHYGGVGITVSVRDNWPIVISPIEGGPAWEAGLRAGDAIVRIDASSAAGLNLEEVADKLRGPAGTEVRLSVRAEGDEEGHDYTLTRREIVTRSVPYAFMAGRRTGYVRLSNFSETSGAEVRAAIARLAAEGATSLVLDLRSNPGGVLEQAVDVSEQLLPRGALIVSRRGRGAGQDSRYYAAGARANLEWPVAVLIDGGSASASEIVAGALQDLDRALLIGQTSYGKGSVQRVFPIAGGSEALKLTTALYYTPSGRSIHRRTRGTSDTEEGDTPDTSATGGDSLPRPRFHTTAGRLVYGGGGITPDMEVIPDSLPPLTLLLERQGLPFRFANRWVNTHPGLKSGAAIGEDTWNAFLSFARTAKVAVSDEAARAERPRLERALRRELARRLSGDAAAARIAFETDPVVQRALAALGHARLPRDVFAGIPDAARPAPAGAVAH